MPIVFNPELESSQELRTRSLRKRRTLSLLDDSDFRATKPKASLFDLLPVELQVEIFTYCLSEFPTMNDDEAPLLIARVCKAWRTLVLYTPKLWSSFEIEISPGSDVGTAYDADRLHILTTMQIWLERSRNYPLNVRLVHSPAGRSTVAGTGATPDLRSLELLAMLVPEARRWRHVQFIVPSASMVALRAALPPDFPALKSLTLNLKGLWNPELGGGGAGSGGAFIKQMGIPWHQLTEIDLQLEQNRRLYLDECLEIMREAVELKKATFGVECSFRSRTSPGVISQRDFEGMTTERVSAMKLESLHIIARRTLFGGGDGIWRPERCLTTVLGLVDCPNLAELQVNWSLDTGLPARQAWSTSHPDFLRFLESVSASLHTLRISYLPISDNELVEYLAVLCQLRHLDLRFPLLNSEHDPITDQLLSALTLSLLPTTPSPSALVVPLPSPSIAHLSPSSLTISLPPSSEQNQTVLLPHLTSLGLECHGKSYSNLTLLSMVQSRWKASRKDSQLSPASRLASFHLLSTKLVLSEMERRVRTWRQEGMTVSIDTLVIR